MRLEPAAEASPARWRGPSLVPLTAALFLLLIGSACLFAPVLEALIGLDSERVDLLARMSPPSPPHLLGTDALGRDLLLRLLHGGRVSLLVGLAGALVTALIGTTIGLMAGLAGGRLDALLMRLTDGIIALPLLPLLVVLAALDPVALGLPRSLAGSELASVWRIVLIVALFGWTTVARLVRAATLSVRTRDYVRAAQALGAGSLRIALVHVLPNVASPIIVATTLSIGTIILSESILSFLGLGVQPPVPSWGNMLTGAQELIWQAPRLAIWPGLLIFLTVVAFNLMGDGLDAWLNPRRGARR